MDQYYTTEYKTQPLSTSHVTMNYQQPVSKDYIAEELPSNQVAVTRTSPELCSTTVTEEYDPLCNQGVELDSQGLSMAIEYTPTVKKLLNQVVTTCEGTGCGDNQGSVRPLGDGVVSSRGGMGYSNKRGFTRRTEKPSPTGRLSLRTKHHNPNHHRQTHNPPLWKQRGETAYRLYVRGWSAFSHQSAHQLEETLWNVFGGEEKGVISCRASADLRYAFVSFSTWTHASTAIRTFRDYPGLHVTWKRGSPLQEPVRTETKPVPVTTFYALVNIYYCAGSQRQGYNRVKNYLKFVETSDEAWTYTLHTIRDNVLGAEKVDEKWAFLMDNSMSIPDRLTQMMTLLEGGSQQRVLYHVGEVESNCGQPLEANLTIEDNGIVGKVEHSRSLQTWRRNLPKM